MDIVGALLQEFKWEQIAIIYVRNEVYTNVSAKKGRLETVSFFSLVISADSSYEGILHKFGSECDH